MIPPRFCKDCRYRGLTTQKCTGELLYNVLIRSDECGATRRVDPIEGDVVDWVSCRERNADFACALFESRTSKPTLTKREESIVNGMIKLYLLTGTLIALLIWAGVAIYFATVQP